MNENTTHKHVNSQQMHNCHRESFSQEDDNVDENYEENEKGHLPLKEQGSQNSFVGMMEEYEVMYERYDDIEMHCSPLKEHNQTCSAGMMDEYEDKCESYEDTKVRCSPLIEHNQASSAGMMEEVKQKVSIPLMKNI